ncbi:MAG: Zinc/iron permease [Promethearchaeota archaeon]|jgi:zinc and cadmium transporter|nr:MAG: Zinc/iron permease [Candidatus Lokiarchaeota archaeon]
MEVIYGFIAIFFIGALSLIGIFMISLKEKTLDSILFVLVAFATGTILATALFDLIPESLHHLEELIDEGASLSENFVFGFIILGYVVFFIIERFIYWFHGHAHQKENEYVCYDTVSENLDMPVEKGPKIKNFALLNLIGDGLHNFLDGVIIIVAFTTSIGSGIVITLAVLFHELPQEVGDFGILLYGGFSRTKALLFNFLSAMIALLGGLFALFVTGLVETFNLFFLAFSGGGFLYLASTELMPELLKQKKMKKSITQALIFLAGIIVIILLVYILPHE